MLTADGWWLLWAPSMWYNPVLNLTLCRCEWLSHYIRMKISFWYDKIVMFCLMNMNPSWRSIQCFLYYIGPVIIWHRNIGLARLKSKMENMAATSKNSRIWTIIISLMSCKDYLLWWDWRWEFLNFYENAKYNGFFYMSLVLQISLAHYIRNTCR